MSSTALALSPKLRATPSVQRVLDQLKSAKRGKREAEEAAELALPPFLSFAYHQLGAAAHGAVVAYSPDKADLINSLLGLGAITAGAMQGSPELIAAGNGALAPITARKTYEILTTRRSGQQPAPQAPQGAQQG